MHAIAQLVQNCRECAEQSRNKREPLITTPLPEYPWQLVGTDLFELDKCQYLLVVDYFSRYPEVIKLSSTTSNQVIAALKTIFARHGIPETVRSDNGPQYSSQEFAMFASSYGFSHVTSSPRYPQSNGQVERMVQTIKRMLMKSPDPHIAVLSYRATPHPWCGYSPAELCMGRRIRTAVPQSNAMLIPQWSYLNEFREKNAEFKRKQKEQFDSRHGAKKLPDIPDDSEVWITSGDRPISGRIVSAGETPRLYVVETDSGELQRNRSHLIVAPDAEQDSTPENAVETEQQPAPATPPRRIMTRTRTGANIQPPERLA